jgi:hypothetical protein
VQSLLLAKELSSVDRFWVIFYFPGYTTTGSEKEPEKKEKIFSLSSIEVRLHDDEPQTEVGISHSVFKMANILDIIHRLN